MTFDDYTTRKNMLIDLLNKVNEKEKDNNENKIIFMETINEYRDCIRQCSVCGKLMCQGYVIESGDGYYCSDDCMQKDGMTREEFEELFNDGNGDSYWTEWI